MYPTEDAELVEQLTREFSIHPVTAQVLISRGITKKKHILSFLYAKLPNLHPPDLMSDIDKATERIHHALQNDEPILIYGDNDVDGMTGTAVLVDFLRTLGAKVYFYVPSRKAKKATTVHEAIAFAAEKHCSLIITVDCGITETFEKSDSEAYKNIDIIITDHHEPTDKLQTALATLNPKLFNSKYPNRDLTGVGVAFKLAHAVLNYLISVGEIQSDLVDLKRYLDLVALGTIADMVPLRGENRILVRYGLQQLKKTQRIGLLKLIHVCDVNPEEISTLDVASKVAPRLNSLGRIDEPVKGVELLLLRDVQEAEKLAKELDEMNLLRKKIEQRDSAVIEKYLKKHPEVLNEKALVFESGSIHPGIVAILAARLVKEFNRPSVVISKEGGLGKGSIRTIREFPVLQLLKDRRDLFVNFGGHDFAAGFTIREENIATFRSYFIEQANNLLSDKDVQPKLYLDARVSFRDLTYEFLESLNLLEPYGADNPTVLLYTVVTQVRAPKVISGKHLKLFLEDGDRFLEGIGFNMAKQKETLNKRDMKLHIAFTPQVNIYLNKSSIQLQIKDFQIA